MKNQFRGNICLLLAALVWGIAFVAQSAGMDYVGPFTFNSIRTLLGGIVLIPVVLITRPKGISICAAVKTEKFARSVIGGVWCGVALSIASSLQQFGISMTTAGKAGFITAMYIVFVPLLGVFIRKRITLIAWICVAVAVVGFYLLSIHEGFTLGTGDLMVLMCAVMFAVYILVVDHFNAKDTNSVLMSFVQFIVAGLIMAVGMFVFEKPSIGAIWQAKVTIGYAGIFSCGLGYTMQIIGQKYTETTIASLLMSLESVFAGLSGWLILGERMSPRELCGCALVFGAVILSQIPMGGRRGECR